MENLDIRNFTLVSGVNSNDYILLAKSDGSDGKIQIQVLLNAILGQTEPSINASRQWVIGSTNTNIDAEGKTPVFKKGTAQQAAILWKYSDEAETQWRDLISWNDLKMNASELTPAQLQSIKLTYEDLSEEDKADLRQPITSLLSTCQTAITNANAAKDAANNAASSANTAISAANTAAASASNAASSATTAAQLATQAASAANEAAGSANDAADAADLAAAGATDAAAAANSAASAANTAAGNVNTAINNAGSATSSANQAATDATAATTAAGTATSNANSAASAANDAATAANEAAAGANTALSNLQTQIDVKVDGIFKKSTNAEIQEMIQQGTWLPGVVYYVEE